ncbi:DUF2188 domain-containing protein [Lacisediminihabitans sp. H27-G8]|uniref:DUF2188 domain-containing protein n=1 Tax=Lacisediminihabitans sp. H27-G8 TaxID=3111909 RepID=UPI0038FCBE1A
MTKGDVETMDKDGQWVNRVIGEPERSESYTSKEEAIEEGQALADQLGTTHTVRPAVATGDITDPQE